MRTALYRYFDSENALLYIGISLSHLQRLSQHRASSSWAYLIASTTVEYYPDKASALLAEAQAIKSERPKHNIIHNKPFLKVVKLADYWAKDRVDPIEKMQIAMELTREFIFEQGWGFDKVELVNLAQWLEDEFWQQYVKEPTKTLPFRKSC